MTLQVKAAGITHRGTVRDNNEDCIAIGFWVAQDTMDAARTFEAALDLPFACVVADGMGGHNDGEQASQLVARGLARRLIAMGTENVQGSVRAVNADFFKHVAENPALAGMGSTAVGMVAHGTSLAIFNVGDSRAFKVGTSALMQLSTDDTPTPNWKPDSGQPRGSTTLLQCFGGRTTFSDVEPHLHVEPCTPGSTYLLCCDGLYETLPEAQIFKLIGEDLQASAEALLRAALAAQARDNVTIALVRVSE